MIFANFDCFHTKMKSGLSNFLTESSLFSIRCSLEKELHAFIILGKLLFQPLSVSRSTYLQVNATLTKAPAVGLTAAAGVLLCPLVPPKYIRLQEIRTCTQ